MVRTFLKVYMELGSYFLFLQEQIKGIIIIILIPSSADDQGSAEVVEINSNAEDQLLVEALQEYEKNK
jgi:hypothetical protein